MLSKEISALAAKLCLKLISYRSVREAPAHIDPLSVAFMALDTGAVPAVHEDETITKAARWYGHHDPMREIPLYGFCVRRPLVWVDLAS